MHFTNSLLLSGILCLSALAARAQACPEDSLPEYLLPQVDITEEAISPAFWANPAVVVTVGGGGCRIPRWTISRPPARPQRKYDTQEELLFMTNSEIWMADPSARNGRN